MSNDIPLPPIEKADRREKVFNHKGLAHDNTRLALLGAALLVTVATAYKLAQYPDRGTGDITTERSLLVKQEAMASYTLHYGLQRELKARENVEKVRETQSAQATLFQAYVAAVFVEREFDFPFIEKWLFALWDMFARTRQ